jgi:2-dehydro-3-deoxyphosphogluconate aldolase/(4S)-4-hydroxy-2-oxoglutarate aldolase
MPSTRAAVLAAFSTHRCSAILRTQDQAAVGPALDAVIAGGFRIVEVTMNTPGCLEHITALSERIAAGERLIVGAGTVLTVDQAKQANTAGAQFLVSPVTDPQVVLGLSSCDFGSNPAAPRTTPDRGISAAGDRGPEKSGVTVP